MTYLEVKMRREMFLFISILLALGVQTLGKSANCKGKHAGSGELGDPAFLQNTTDHVYSTQCHYRVLSCRSTNFCSIQWFFNGVPYDSWHLGENSGTEYLLEENNQTLKFTSADVDADGVYTCVVSNGVTSINRTIDLKVVEEIWLYKPIPYESNSGVCKNQTAVLGGNATFFCQFKYRRAGVFFLHSWRKLNETYGGYELVSFYDIPGTDFTEDSVTEEESFTKSEICPEQVAPKIFSTWLNITNVTEEALGKYLVTCQIAQYLTAINLTLSLEVTDESVTTVTNTGSVVTVVVTMTILLSLLLLSWKLYGTDAKLWYHDHHGKLETEEKDGKIYDAYIISCYEGKDRLFVDDILYPSLQDQYKLFLRQRDATFGSVVSEEIVETLSKSRRCIVILSADFYRPLPTSSAVQQSPSSSSSSSPVEMSEYHQSEKEWHLFELQQALDTMHPHVIPLLYRDSGPNTLSTTDSSAKLIDHVIKDLKCVGWKQKNETRVDDWAMKRLRLRLPPRRRNNKLLGEPSLSVILPVVSAKAPSNISSSMPWSNPSVLPSDTPDSTSVSESESSKCPKVSTGDIPKSSDQKRPSQSSQISFMSTSMSPTSLSAPMSLSSSYGSGSMSIPSPYCNSSLAFSPSHPSTDSGIVLKPDNLNTVQEHERNSNRFNFSFSFSKLSPRSKKEPYLIENENVSPSYI